VENGEARTGRKKGVLREGRQLKGGVPVGLYQSWHVAGKMEEGIKSPKGWTDGLLTSEINPRLRKRCRDGQRVQKVQIAS